MTESTENIMETEDEFYMQLAADMEEQRFHCPVELTKESILQNAVFDPLYALDTEAEMERYLCAVRQTAKQLKVTGEFDRLARAHKKEAVKLLKQRQTEKRRAAVAAKRARCSAPPWLQYNHFDEPFVNEPLFLQWFLSEKELRCIHGRFYSVDGQIPEDEIRNRIHHAISAHLYKNIAKITENLFRGLVNHCYSESIQARKDEIHVQNGVLFTNGSFLEQRHFCVNRLSVTYRPDAPEPKKFLQYLHELLYEEDVVTLQEFLGYCLIPSTKAQVMLFLIGSGGEGKGVLGDILSAMFKNNMATGKIQKLATDKYMIADLEDKLLFLDDDMNFEGIRDTGTLKSVVTASTPFPVERKYANKHDSYIYARLLCFGNNCLNSLYDHTDGFYRRQVIIQTKPKAEGRMDNPLLASEIIKEEMDSVFLWAFTGLQQLLRNQFQLTISERAKQALQTAKDDGFNLHLFLQDEALFGEEYEMTTADLYHNYEVWCSANGFSPFKRDTVVRHLKNNAERLGIAYSNHCNGYNQKQARGFKGIKTRTKAMCGIF